jgi:hypothetical protein
MVNYRHSPGMMTSDSTRSKFFAPSRKMRKASVLPEQVSTA